MSAIKKLYEFLQNITGKSVHIDVEELDIAMLGNLFSGKTSGLKELNKMRTDEFKNNYNIDLTNEQLEYFYLTSCVLRWNRGEQKPREGLLTGGFSFNGISDLFRGGNKFWEASEKDFKEFEDEKFIEQELLQKLRWIETPASRSSGIYTPQYGCVIPEKGKFPDQFYFYDSGLIFPLPFHSYEDYINALADSAAVRCWQYFYIDPAIIIQKNKGISYITWSPREISKLEPGIDDLKPNKNIRSDRLDLINEYMERCVQLLPPSFPWLDFSHHEKQYAAFSKLYKKSKQ